MAMVINSNIQSLNAQRNLTLSQGEQSQAMERLTSGKRINSAADDAAGLSIANRMTSQVRGLDQAIRNANDGISLIQTAEGALDETTNILQRMRELSIQSANGTYDSGNRATMNAEVQQLISEIDRISETTKFNGLQILDGTLGKVDLQAGADANETISLEIGAMNSTSLGGSAGDIVGSASTGGLADFTTVFTADGDITINDTAISAIDHAAATTNTLNEITASINADLEGKGAEVSALTTVEGTSVGTGILRAGTDTFKIDVVDGDGNAQSYIITGTNSMDELVSKINDETSVSATLNEKGYLVLSQENVLSIQTTDSTASPADKASGITDATTNFSLVINDTSAEQNGVKIEIAANTTADELQALGLNAQDDNGNIQGDEIATTTNAAEGDLIINGVAIGAVTLDATPTAAEKQAEAIKQINLLSDETGVVAFAGTATSSIALRSTTGGEISIEAGNDLTSAQLYAHFGLTERNAVSGAGSVAGINISTAEGAQKAIGTIDKALEQINSTRGDLGAVNNRLDFTVNNLSNVSENVAAARSRIEDADFAKESANLSRAQVLQQAGTAMLAQANAAPQQVLSLLQ